MTPCGLSVMICFIRFVAIFYSIIVVGVLSGSERISLTVDG